MFGFILQEEEITKKDHVEFYNINSVEEEQQKLDQMTESKS